MIKPGLSVCIAAMSLVASPAFCQQAEPFVGAHGAMVPATYEGGEGGGTWHLDLWPDQGFHLRRTLADGAGAPESFAGRWHANGEALVLDLGAESLELEVRNAQRLRPSGAPEDATDDLVTDGSLDPATISLPASGMFTYFADAPTFVHCATGRMHPVAQEGDYPALEAAYLNDRPGLAEPLFVTFKFQPTSRHDRHLAGRRVCKRRGGPLPDRHGLAHPVPGWRGPGLGASRARAFFHAPRRRRNFQRLGRLQHDDGRVLSRSRQPELHPSCKHDDGLPGRSGSMGGAPRRGSGRDGGAGHCRPDAASPFVGWGRACGTGGGLLAVKGNARPDALRSLGRVSAVKSDLSPTHLRLGVRTSDIAHGHPEGTASPVVL